MKHSGSQQEDAVRYLVEHLGPRLLEFLFLRPSPDLELARTLHTQLSETLWLLRGDATW